MFAFVNFRFVCVFSGFPLWQRNNPWISGIVSDGTAHYPHDSDNLISEQGGSGYAVAAVAFVVCLSVCLCVVMWRACFVWLLPLGTVNCIFFNFIWQLFACASECSWQQQTACSVRPSRAAGKDDFVNL